MTQNGKKTLIHRLTDIIEGVDPRTRRIDLVRDDIREAIEHIQELEATITDPRRVSLTRDRFMQLLAFEAIAEKARIIIAKQRRLERWQKLHSQSQSCSLSSSSQEH